MGAVSVAVGNFLGRTMNKLVMVCFVVGENFELPNYARGGQLDQIRNGRKCLTIDSKT